MSVDPFHNEAGLGRSQRERVAETYAHDPVIEAKALQYRQKEPGFEPDRAPWRDRFVLFLTRCARRFRKGRDL